MAEQIDGVAQHSIAGDIPVGACAMSEKAQRIAPDVQEMAEEWEGRWAGWILPSGHCRGIEHDQCPAESGAQFSTKESAESATSNCRGMRSQPQYLRGGASCR
jgi:hypothetical protein